MTINQAFNASIQYYDDWMKKALPNYNDLFDSAQALLPFPPSQPINVLDLGAGTGLFSEHILTMYPHAQFVLYDVADQMLNIAKKRFQAYPSQFEFIVDDYRTLQRTHEFDLVISSLSIHHITDEEKQNLFRSIYKALRTTGLFINIDQIRGETAYLRNLYWQHWLTQVRQRKSSESQIQDSIRRRTTYDKDALLTDQLQWLRNAGFRSVDCVYKNFFVGVFLAMKE